MEKTDISIKSLIEKVRHGELLLPEMQRKYVWRATRVRDLLDSLYRGYPSGIILVWETDEDVESVSLATAPNSEPTTGQRQLLLDGQQRITSLTAILDGQPITVRNKKKPIEILFNLEHPEGGPIEITEVDDDASGNSDDEDDEDDDDVQEKLQKMTFVVANKALASNPVWVHVTDIFRKTDREILKPLGITSFDDPRYEKYSERLKKVRDIENYMYVMQRLGKEMSYEEVTEIFVRVNSLGAKLRGSDLALAQITAKWKGFMRTLEEYAKTHKEDEYYILETGLPVRMLAILSTKQSRFKTIGRRSAEDLKNVWAKAKDALDYAINFIHSNAQIDSLDYLSSPFLLIPIGVYYILKDGSISNEEEKKLLKWFFYAHMRGHYSMGSSESILDSDLGVLYKTQNLDELIKNLNLHVKKFNVDSSDLLNKGKRSPFFSMIYFVLKYNRAKDWSTGLALSESHRGGTHKIQFHHIFPKSLLQEMKYDKKEINEIANFAFIGGKTNRQILNKEPIIYLEKEVLLKFGEIGLDSQLITKDKSLWNLKKYQDFLAWRREQIANAINKFMERFE